MIWSEPSERNTQMHGVPDSAARALDVRVLDAVGEHPFWGPYLAERVVDGWKNCRLHVAVFVEPFLGHILTGRKTVESRFSSRRVPPFSSVPAGDVILLKVPGGPVVGLCRAETVWFYRLNPRSWGEIRDRFASAMCAEDPTFWVDRRTRRFATLIRIADVSPVPSIDYSKRDRRGWIVECPASEQLELTEPDP